MTTTEPTNEGFITALDDNALADALCLTPSIWSSEEFYSLLVSEGYRRKIITPREDAGERPSPPKTGWTECCQTWGRHASTCARGVEGETDDEPSTHHA